MWQRFMTRLLEDTDIKERITEHDLRGKVGSEKPALREPPTCSATPAKRLQTGTVDASQNSSSPSADPLLHARD
jgi:hypothetical protein